MNTFRTGLGGSMVMGAALVCLGACSAESDDGDAPVDSAETTSEELVGGVAMVPATDVAHSNVVGVADAVSLFKDVDDGTTLSAADDAASYVRSAAGTTSGSHTVAFSGGPSGTVTDVVVQYRAQASSGTGSVQVLLYDGTTLLKTGARRSLTASWTSYKDSYSGLSVSAASHLRAKVVLRAGTGSSVVRYTQIVLQAASSGGSSCRSTGTSCALSTDCCTFDCAGGVCACVLGGRSCRMNAQCCSGSCVGGVCH